MKPGRAKWILLALPFLLAVGILFVYQIRSEPKTPSNPRQMKKLAAAQKDLLYHGEGEELVGKAASEWTTATWFTSAPLTLKAQRGKVVLVRWWTGPECPYCRASAPALNELYDKYKDKGLVVIGMYHHKSPEPLTKQHVEGLIQRYHFQFPVAIDPDWTTLKAWWLNEDREFTSVSYLLDQNGVIQFIHPGGTISARDEQTLGAKIKELLRKNDNT